MRRTDRLFEIIQLFRGGRLILGREIAEHVEVSLRTVYRDIETLIASGVPIEGERGVGYILREPIFLPPLTLTTTELEALHLGMEIVQKMPDEALTQGAKRLMDKINTVLPDQLRDRSHLDHLSVHEDQSGSPLRHLPPIRKAIAGKQVIGIRYSALNDEVTERKIKPLNVEYWGKVWTCTAWCELRDSFRVFRIDRIQSCDPTGGLFVLEKGQTYEDYLIEQKKGHATR